MSFPSSPTPTPPTQENKPTVFEKFSNRVLDLSARLTPKYCTTAISFSNLRKEVEELSRIPEDPGFKFELIRQVTPQLRIAHDFSLLPVEGDKSKSSYSFSPFFVTDFKKIFGSNLFVSAHYQLRASLNGVFFGFYPSFVLARPGRTPSYGDNSLSLQINSRAPSPSPIQQVVASLSSGGGNIEAVYSVRENYFMLGFAQQIYKKIYLGVVSILHPTEDETLATQWQGSLRWESNRSDKGGSNIFTLLVSPYIPSLSTSFSRRVNKQLTVTTDLQVTPSRENPEMEITSQTGLVYTAANQGQCYVLFNSGGTFQFSIEEPLGPIGIGLNVGYNFKTNDARVGAKLLFALEEPLPQ